MKYNKITTRMIALGLAILLGIGSIHCETVSANAEKNLAEESGCLGTEDKSEDVYAQDIKKDISDKTFSVETCLDGIYYDAEKEEVSFISIQMEDGSSYEQGKIGTYIANYKVIPKDGTESYIITRKIVITDTVGETCIESEDEKKEDAEEEDELQTAVQIFSDVEVKTTDETVSEETLEQLAQDIAEGNSVILTGAARTATASETVTLVKGETIWYPSYLGNFFTCWYRVNGKIAYCLESQKNGPASGSYVAQVLNSNENLQKVLYYGYGGAGDVTSSYLSNKTSEEKYIYTHIAASYAYAGGVAFAGCEYSDLVNAGVISYIDYLFAKETPPKGELSLSKTKLTAVREGDIQKTANITLEGDYRNYIELKVPAAVTAHNLTKGTSVTNGKIKIYGGDKFYLSANLLVTGKYASGNMSGSIKETWRTLVLSTGSGYQDIGVFETETASTVSFEVQWLEMTRIELTKKDIDTKNPLKGAIYGIYTDKECKKLLLTMEETGTTGKAVSDYFDATLKMVYVKEVKAPENYLLSEEIYKVEVSAGQTINVIATDERVTGKVTIAKIDKETGSFVPQGDGKLSGAVYGIYAKEDIIHPDGATGVVYKKDSLIAQGVIGESGTLSFSELYLGEMYVQEIVPSEGYLLDATKYEVTVTYEGQNVAEVKRELIVEEQVKKQAFQMIKISEDGEQTETDLVLGAGFKVYLIQNLSEVKNGNLKPENGENYTSADFVDYDFSKEQVAVLYENGTEIPIEELFTDTKGYIRSPELAYGSYVVVESTTPENLVTINPFVVKIEEDNREPMVWRVFDDRPFEFLLKIVKRDAQTGNVVLKAGASYKIYDVVNEQYVEQYIQYPKKEKISIFKTNEEGYLVTPQSLRCSTYRIEEVEAPEGFVRTGNEVSLYEEGNIVSLLEQVMEGEYKENPKSSMMITVTSNTAYQIDPDTEEVIIQIDQYNDEQVGSLTLMKYGEQLKMIKEDSFFESIKDVFSEMKAFIAGNENEGISKEFVYEESGVKGAVFELYAKETIYSPDGERDAQGNSVVRYYKDDLIARMTTDQTGKAVVNNLPLGSYYIKEVVAGENFILNEEQKEFTLSAEDDTQAVVYEAVAYKNERQKVAISIEKRDSNTGKLLEGVVFGLYTREDIYSAQGELLVKKDSLLERKATDEEGKLQFLSDLPHGKYYVKEEIRKPGYVENEEIWEIDALYENQQDTVIVCEKEIENQPTETHFTKTDATTEEEVEGARLQIIAKDGTVVEEWISKKEEHVVYGLPEGTYMLHEEAAPYEDGYVSASDVYFEVKEDGSVTKVEMKDDYSKVAITKSDIATGEELKGATLQIIDKNGDILEEWITDGTEHIVTKLPVNEELTLREISAPEGYEIAEDVTFVLEDTMEIQKVEMKDLRTPENVDTPKTGDEKSSRIWMLALIVSGSAMVGFIGYRKKKTTHTIVDKKG